MGAESGAAAGPYGIAFGTDTSAAGAFLTPGFLGAARNLTSGFAFMSASSFRSLIQNNGLVHQRNIDFGFKDGGIEFHFTGFLALHIINLDISHDYPPFLRRLLML